MTENLHFVHSNIPFITKILQVIQMFVRFGENHQVNYGYSVKAAHGLSGPDARFPTLRYRFDSCCPCYMGVV